MTGEIEKFPRALNKKEKICWIISFCVALALMLIPTNEVFTLKIKIFFAITVFFILVLAFELMDNYIPSLFLPAAYIVTKVATPAIALAPWLSELPWVILSTFLLVNVVEKTGLLKRVAYWIILKTGGTYKGILYGLLFAGIVLNLMLPGGMVVPLIAISYGICVALELGQSKTATGIMLAGGVGAILPTMFIIAPPYFGLVLNSGRITVPDLSIGFLPFIFQNAIYIIFCFMMVFLISKMFKPDVDFQGKEYFQKVYKSLGKVCCEEKKATFVIIALVIYLLTMDIHKLGMGWGFSLAACAMFAPGINLGVSEDIRNINMSVVMFAGSCLSIGTVATSLGIGDIMARAVMPFLEGNSAVRLFSITMLVTFILNFIMTPSAIVAILAGPLAKISIDLGINPIATLTVLNSSGYQVLLPYEHTSFLILYSFGLISSKNFMKFFGANALAHFVFVLLLVLPYWKLIGVL